MGFIEIPYFPKTYSRNKPYITKIRKASQTTIKLRPLRRDDVIPNFKCRIYLEKVNFSALFQRPAKSFGQTSPYKETISHARCLLKNKCPTTVRKLGGRIRGGVEVLVKQFVNIVTRVWCYSVATWRAIVSLFSWALWRLFFEKKKMIWKLFFLWFL